MPQAPEQFLYLTTTGHKSGKPHHIEIWFVAHEGCFYIVAEKREQTHWIQNIRHDPYITFRIGTKTAKPDDPSYIGHGRVINPDDEPPLTQAVSALMDAKYGWSNGLIVELKPNSNR